MLLYILHSSITGTPAEWDAKLNQLVRAGHYVCIEAAPRDEKAVGEMMQTLVKFDSHVKVIRPSAPDLITLIRTAKSEFSVVFAPEDIVIGQPKAITLPREWSRGRGYNINRIDILPVYVSKVPDTSSWSFYGCLSGLFGPCCPAAILNEGSADEKKHLVAPK